MVYEGKVFIFITVSTFIIYLTNAKIKSNFQVISLQYNQDEYAILYFIVLAINIY